MITSKTSKVATTFTVTERAAMDQAIKESLLMSESQDLPATFIVTEISKPKKKLKSPSPVSEQKRKKVIILKS